MARVLVIEDDTDNRHFLKQLLEVADYDVHTARDGQDALTWLRTHRLLPDCIVLDLDMPIMTGEEFVDHLRAEPRFSTIRIIILSGDLQQRANALSCAHTCLEKPAAPEALVGAVAECVESRR
jgi:chemosensory pili system protein ChpA (sensor histidine kinase/response regulator)